jgi:hypothetical protein
MAPTKVGVFFEVGLGDMLSNKIWNTSAVCPKNRANLGLYSNVGFWVLRLTFCLSCFCHGFSKLRHDKKKPPFLEARWSQACWICVIQAGFPNESDFLGLFPMRNALRRGIDPQVFLQKWRKGFAMDYGWQWNSPSILSYFIRDWFPITPNQLQSLTFECLGIYWEWTDINRCLLRWILIWWYIR